MNVSYRSSDLPEPTPLPQLWKTLFSQDFLRGTQRLEDSLPTLSDLGHLFRRSGLTASTAQHGEIRGLPLRFYSAARHRIRGPTSALKGKARDLSGERPELCWESLRNDGLEWKCLYRVSANWRSGSFTVTELLEDDSSRRRNEKEGQGHHSTQPETRTVQDSNQPDTLVQSSAHLIFTALRCRSDRPSSPLVNVYLDPSGNSNRGSTPRDPTSSEPIAELHSLQLQHHHQSLAGIHVTQLTVSAPDSNPLSSDNERIYGSDVRLFVAYSTGDWSIFHVKAPNNHVEEPMKGQIVSEELCFWKAPTCAPLMSIHVALCAFHWPLIVTCTNDFLITIFGLSHDGRQAPHVLQQTKSPTSYWPATMKLKEIVRAQSPRLKKRKRTRSLDQQSARPLTSGRSFRLDIAYCTPSYPDNWSLSLQELVFSLDESHKRSYVFSSRYATSRPRQATRVCRQDERLRRNLSDSQKSHSDDSGSPQAFPTKRNISRHRIFTPPTLMHSSNHASLQATRPSRTVSSVKSISYDEPYLVIGSDDNLLDVYEVCGAFADSLDSEAGPNLSVPLTLIHRRVLYGHMGSVLSVAIQDGRCVSGSSDGSILVWSLARNGSKDGNPSCPVEEDLMGRPVVTLRCPSSSTSPAKQTASSPSDDEPSSLRNLLPRMQNSETSSSTPFAASVDNMSPRPGIIKWVSTAFDKVLSVISADPKSPDRECLDAHQRPASSGEESEDTGCHAQQRQRQRQLQQRGQQERVQVWSFCV